MDKRAKAFIGVVAAAALVFVTWHLAFYPLSHLPRSVWGDVLAFALVGLLSQAAAIDFGRDRQATSSMAFIPFLASAIVLPPLASILVAASVVVVSEFAITRRVFLKGLFNVAQLVLAIGLSAHAYSALATPSSTSAVQLAPFAVLVVTFFGINILLSTFAISLYRSQPFAATLFEVAGPRGGNLIYDLFASWIVVLAVLVYAEYKFWGILVMVISLLVIRHVYFSRRKLEEANNDLLTVLVKAIETRDPYTSGHSIRVSTLAALIAEDLGLSRRRVERVRRAALLHDIGKIHPEFSAVLKKPHDLTPEERELIQTHAAIGADLLRNLSSVDSDIIAAVRHHHERYDGKGYPDKLWGDSIPLYARIIMMCDSIDAMLSDRPYRAALTLEAVKTEIYNNQGTQFDPRIVRTVLAAKTLEKAFALVNEWRPSTTPRAASMPDGTVFPMGVAPEHDALPRAARLSAAFNRA